MEKKYVDQVSTRQTRLLRRAQMRRRRAITETAPPSASVLVALAIYLSASDNVHYLWDYLRDQPGLLPMLVASALREAVARGQVTPDGTGAENGDDVIVWDLCADRRERVMRARAHKTWWKSLTPEQRQICISIAEDFVGALVSRNVQ